MSATIHYSLGERRLLTRVLTEGRCAHRHVALTCGGCAAAWMTGVSNRADGTLHGVVAWGIATLFAVGLLSSASAASAGSYLGSSTLLLGAVAAALGGSAAARHNILFACRTASIAFLAR